MEAAESPAENPPASGGASEAMVTRTTIVTHDGLRLAVEHHLLRLPRSRVILLHGYGEHAGRYGELTDSLLRAGHECHLFDLRGHGRSEGARGHVRRFDHYGHDLDRVVEAVMPGRAASGDVRAGAAAASGAGASTAAASNASRKLFLVAHSLGGLIALDYVIRRPGVFDGLAASSPYLALQLKIAWPLLRAGELLGRVVPSLRIPGRLDSRLLTHDVAIAGRYASDPLVLRNTTPGWYVETRAAQRRVWERAGEVRLPVLFLLGADDPVARAGRSEDLFEQLGSADKTLKRYEGLLHEVFNEVSREVVVGDLLAWLEERSPVTDPPAAATPRGR